jgi:hypothetical protein
MKTKYIILQTFLICFWLHVPYLAAADKPTIYIKDLVAGKGVSFPQAAKVSSAIEKAIIQLEKYSVMSQSQVRELLKNISNQQLLGCNSEACLRQIMSTTQTDYIIYGELSKEEGEYAVSVNLMHRKSEGNAEVKATATQFTTTFYLRSLTLLSSNIVKELHGEKVSVSTSEIEVALQKANSSISK